MNTHAKKLPFFNDSLVFPPAKRNPFLSPRMKLLTLFFLLFSGLFLNIKAHAQQVPAKVKVVAVKSTLSVAKKGKKKTRKLKKVVIKKDTMPEIDPANINSPLYNKN